MVQIKNGKIGAARMTLTINTFFRKLIIFIIGIMNISSVVKADNFLGNCNIGNEGQYLNTALQLVDEFNFKTEMFKEKLVYCNLSNITGITFTMIPYNKDFIGNGQYISIGQAGNTSCINFIIVDTKNLQSNENQMLSVDLNNRTGNYDLSSNNFRSKYCN
jgi:hypothetical protein